MKTLTKQQEEMTCRQDRIGNIFDHLFEWRHILKLILFFVVMLSAVGVKAGDDILWQNLAYGTKVLFNSTGNLICVSDNSGNATLINSFTGQIIRTYFSEQNLTSHKFSRDGNIFAYNRRDFGIVFIDTKTLDTIRISKIKSDFFDFSIDDKYLITANLSVAGIFINKYDINTDSLISKFTFLFSPNKNDIRMDDFAVSPTGNKIAFAGMEIFGMNDGVSYNRIIDLDNNRIIGSFSSTTPYFKYSSNSILGSIDNGKIKFYDDKVQMIKTLIDSNYFINDFCFNESANEIITSSNSHGIKVWDFNSLKLKTWYQNPKITFYVYAMGFSKEKQMLAVRSDLFYGLDYSKIVSVSEQKDIQPEIRIIPNPTVNQVTITIQKENLKNIYFNVTDLSGKMLLSKDYLNINSNVFNATINTSNLPSGTLFFNLTIDGKLFTKQVILMK